MNSAQFAEATKLIGVVSISSPGPRPAAAAAPCSAAVPLAKATAWRACTASASAASKRSTRGPWVMSGSRRAARTASTSAGSIDWRP